jgi:dTMP kinase
MKKKGKFIVLDGCEGAGKTTLIQNLKSQMKGLAVTTTHEPGGTPFADAIRKLILSDKSREAEVETLFALMWGARAEHMRKKIIPILDQGGCVLCDRFDSSTYAYQVIAQKAKHLEKLFWIIRENYLGRYKPDLYIFLDVDPEIGLKRISKRKGKKTHFDNRDIEFHKLVHKGFKMFLKKVPHIVIDSNKSIIDVRDDVFRVVKNLI